MSRARAEAVIWIDDHTCHGCGGDFNETLEPGRVYDVDTETVCHSCAALALVRRDEQRAHEGDKINQGRFAYDDGRIYTVSGRDNDGRAT